jgi:ornithine cyclodeaminase/alanine dehydrogenase-like protein (mu-crystallin family)
LVLGEADVAGLLDMGEVVSAVEEAFRRQGEGMADNSPRTRSRAPGAVLNVMHGCLPYLGRGGVKCYMSSRAGTKFVFALFDLADARLLAIMGADALGRFRTGGASGVATRLLYGRGSARLAVCGTGRQAFTQVLAAAAVTSISEVKVWSPDQGRREAFRLKLEAAGFTAEASGTPAEAIGGADLVSTMTSAREPFVEAGALEGVRHLNACGSNQPDRAEVAAAAFRHFRGVVVDDLRQAKTEYGDLVLAEKAGTFSWESAVELKEVAAGKAHPEAPTLFKSGGVAIEDVAVASLVYDKAVRSGRYADSEVNLP